MYCIYNSSLLSLFLDPVSLPSVESAEEISLDWTATDQSALLPSRQRPTSGPC